MLLSERASTYPTVKSRPLDRRRRRPTIRASYSLFPTLAAGRLLLAFGFNGVGRSAEIRRINVPGIRWFTRGRVLRSRPSEYTTSALNTVLVFNSCDQP